MASEDLNDIEGFSKEDILSEAVGFGLDAQSDISFSSVRTSELSDFCAIDDEEINNSYSLLNGRNRLSNLSHQKNLQVLLGLQDH